MNELFYLLHLFFFWLELVGTGDRDQRSDVSSIISVILNRWRSYFVPENFNEFFNELSRAHLNISGTYKRENHVIQPFLDILMARRPEGQIQTTINRKATWNGEYILSASFVPVAYDRSEILTAQLKSKRGKIS